MPKKDSPIGICGLCKCSAQLIDSHLIPKAAYKKLRRAVTDENGGQLIVNENNKSFYSDKQVSNHFLCSKCENLFSEKGERIVLNECFSGSEFTLLDRISKAKGTEDYLKAIDPIASELPYSSDYLYFAASVIWRGSAWPDENHKPRKTLGDKLEEDFRLFLLGKQKFPDRALVVVKVDTDIEKYPLVTTPTFNKEAGFFQHYFFIPGVLFFVLVGDEVIRIKRRLKNNYPILFKRYSFQKSSFYDVALNAICKNEALGKLSKMKLD